MDDPSTVFDAAFWTTAGFILMLLVMSGFFSGSETALTAASRGKLRAQADKGSRGAERARRSREEREGGDAPRGRARFPRASSCAARPETGRRRAASRRRGGAAASRARVRASSEKVLLARKLGSL